MTSTGEGWTTASHEAMPRSDGRSGPPGLVLVYSRLYAELPSVFVITRSSHRIGREVTDAHDVRLPENAVSRQHAVVEARADGVWIVDLGSTNGTLVNGERVQAARLADHDIVRIGDSVFRFASDDAVAYAAYRVDGQTHDALRRHRPRVPSALVGGHQIDAILARVEKVAPTHLSCVVTGESGTGKELLARTIHDASGRSGRLVALNCAALPATLLESELFGYVKGAFTGATQDKEGLVAAAHGGTLFLDEIGDMSLEAQARLLRVLQTREVLPVGARVPRAVDVRVVCATHRDLEAEVAAGRFRGDLLARLREFQVRLPPLRERREDLFRLVRHFLRREGRSDAVVTLPFMVALAHHPWPYNVRELESAVRLAVTLAGEQPLAPEHLPESVQASVREHGRVQGSPSSAKVTPKSSGARAESPRPIERAVAPSESELRDACLRHAGNVSAIAKEYGKAREQIHRWLRRYAIDVATFRVPR